MARSALMPDVKGCKSIMVSVPWAIHGVNCHSHIPAQSSDGWSFGSFCIIAPDHEIKMSMFLNQRTNEFCKKMLESLLGTGTQGLK